MKYMYVKICRYSYRYKYMNKDILHPGTPFLSPFLYRSTSPTRRRPPPYDPPMNLGMGLR